MNYRKDYTGQDFSGQDLSYKNFSNCNLFGCNFTGARCVETHFIGANLNEADFTNCNLQEASFEDALLCRTTFTNAYLGETIFDGADLREADLRGAHMKNAFINNASMYEAMLTAPHQLPKFMSNVKDMDTVRFDTIIGFPHNDFIQNTVATYLDVQSCLDVAAVNSCDIGPYRLQVQITPVDDRAQVDIALIGTSTRFEVTLPRKICAYHVEDYLHAIFCMEDMFDVLDQSQVTMMLSRSIDVINTLHSRYDANM